MNKHTITTIAAAISIAFSIGASAQNISKSEYKTGKATIAAEYKTAKENCKALSENAKDVCMADAKGKSKVATAELDAPVQAALAGDLSQPLAKRKSGLGAQQKRAVGPALDKYFVRIESICFRQPHRLTASGHEYFG